ncbi:glutaminyl-peptide cyclotransferase [Flavobacterium haoranii]|uniref:Glutamine cyclotransferase n=1 Tax=Flavobacterium haoranii TaxID=683124 RepID=A0A1M6MFD3_9FLAO|nr:glutaminyl-peptide cyclotransferase [Flavobacterium haoranii]SHJ82155.1 Glutamine cyclotransferase [Flavobacterium haoranii]
MLNPKLLAFITLAIITNACDGDKKNLNDSFSIDTSNLKQVYTTNEGLDLSVKNLKNVTIDSIVYYINENRIGKSLDKLHYDFTNEKLGPKKVKAKIYTTDGDAEVETNLTIASSIEPKLLKYKIINTYPHDIHAYTQGFEFHNDILFEGTGNGAGSGTGVRDTSSIRKTDYKTGKILKKHILAQQYFGEGITILNNKLYQLTWQNNEGYVYDVETFEKLKTFKYFKDMQGWGLTNDGSKLYMSEGSEKIYVLDPETLKEVDYINVYTQHAKIEALNELEWIDGKIWANVYGRDAIAIINTKGEVESIINLSDLRSKVTQHPDIDVLNGIAYNPKTKTIFVTGKNWDKTFEIVIEE